MPQLLIFVSILLVFSSCTEKMSNAEAFEHVISTTTFEDTVLNYTLYSDSLVLEYENPPKIKHWRGEVFLLVKNSDDCINVHFPDNNNGFLGKIEFLNNRVVLDGFHISEDSLSMYTVNLRASPCYPGRRSIAPMYGPLYLFRSDSLVSNQFNLNHDIDDWEITSFDLVKMKNLPKEQREFCQDSIEQSYGLWITDVEIAESSYNW